MQKPVDTDSIVMLGNTDSFDNQDELFVRFECTVDKGQAPVRIDKYLAEHIPGTSRSRIQAAADIGQVLANGKVVNSSYKSNPVKRYRYYSTTSHTTLPSHPSPFRWI